MEAGQFVEWYYGILVGWTAMVGQLSPALTGRLGKGKWIAAAFNGYGRHLALMMSGGGRVADRLPGAYELSEHRLQSILTPTQAIESLS